MPIPKKEAKRVLDSLPDAATFEDIQYALYICHEIAQGIEDADAGRVIPHEEVVRRMDRWLGDSEGSTGS